MASMAIQRVTRELKEFSGKVDRRIFDRTFLFLFDKSVLFFVAHGARRTGASQ
jgi:hypothetical protein